MSDFVLLSTDASLWELATKVRLGLHDFCPVGISFQVWVTMQAQLNTPLSGRSMGGCWKAPVGHCIPPNHTNHCCWIWDDLWPCHSMDMSPPSLLPYTRGGGPQTCFAREWKCGLGIHLCTAEWGPIPCVPIKQGTCQHDDRWCTQCRCLWLAPPAADMQTFAVQGHGSMPRRLEWWVRSLAVYLSEADPLGCCHSWWTCPQTVTDNSGPWGHAGWGCINPFSGCPIYTNPTPLPENTTEPPSDIAAAINLQFTGAMRQLQGVTSIASASASWQGTLGKQPLPAAGDSEYPLWWEGIDSVTPVPLTTFPQTFLHMASSASILSLAQVTSQLFSQRHLRWWASPSSHSPRPPPRVEQLACQMSSLSYRRKWVWL